MNSKAVWKHLARTVALLVVVCLPAFANNSHTFHTQASVVTSDGKAIPAGVYQVSWQTHSPTATVTFKQGNRIVATVEAHWADRSDKYQDDAILYQRNPDGTNTLIEIRFAGRNQVLLMDNSR